MRGETTRDKRPPIAHAPIRCFSADEHFDGAVCLTHNYRKFLGGLTEDRAAHLRTVVRPLQDRVEPLSVVPGSDAEGYAAKRFPRKRLRRISNRMRPGTLDVQRLLVRGHLRLRPWRDGARFLSAFGRCFP